MALTFEYCRSCGGKTQIDTAVPAEERRCELCGEACSGVEDVDDVEGPEWMQVKRRYEAGELTHTPVELVAANCPRCRADIAIDPDKPLRKQRCTACGRLLEDARRKGRERKRNRFTPDGVLVRRARERVWMPMAGVVLVVVPALIFAIWLAWRKEPAALAPEDGGALPPRVQIRELLARFTAAKSPEELLPLIRDPDKFEKPLREWCAAHPGALPLGGELMKIEYPRDSLGTSLAEAIIGLPNQIPTHLLTVATPDGYKVEWRAFSGVGDMTVADFLAQKPSAPTLLITVVHRSDYHNNAYADSEAWQCLRVRDHAGNHPFFAYVPRGNAAIMDAISHLPHADSRRSIKLASVSRPMALRLHFTGPESANALQAEVDSVAGDEWYVP